LDPAGVKGDPCVSGGVHCCFLALTKIVFNSF